MLLFIGLGPGAKGVPVKSEEGDARMLMKEEVENEEAPWHEF